MNLQLHITEEQKEQFLLKLGYNKKEIIVKNIYFGESGPSYSTLKMNIYYTIDIDNKFISNKYYNEMKEEYDAQFVDYEIMFDINKINFIYSVKRLSDGEIFTIGDKMYYSTDSENHQFKKTGCIIQEFTIENNKIYVNRHYASGNKNYILENWVKFVTKQPLFTTEDGVDIYDINKDKFYWVIFKDNNNVNRVDKLWEICEIKNYCYFRYEPEYEKYFSTKKAAEEYIIENKPCLSLKNVKDNYLESLLDVNEGFLYKLKKVVKSKL